MTPDVVGMLCDSVDTAPAKSSLHIPEWGFIPQPVLADVTLQPGGGEKVIVQLSKPGSVTRFARVGLTEARSKAAAKADARQQSMGFLLHLSI